MTIHAGDIVRIGDNALTWEVVAIYPGDEYGGTDCARLKSGQTGRARIEPLANLTLYRYGVDE